MTDKVFCIGFQKTGTSSIGKALRILGYKVHGGFRFNLPGKVQIANPVTLEKLAELALPIAKDYTAFQDNPWCLLFRELDKAYPDSKFILTRREPEAWMTSVARHFQGISSPTMDFIYGAGMCPDKDREHFLSVYDDHNQAVIEYFEHRPNDLLIFDLETADWAPLCEFLEKRRPVLQAYPHRNDAQTRERNKERKRRREAGLFSYLQEQLSARWS